jgi:lysophospholipase L1-like esterase
MLDGKPLFAAPAARAENGVNRSVAMFGHSMGAQATAVTATERSKLSQGYIGWLQFLTKQRIDFVPEDNFAVSGENSAQILVRMTSARTSASIFIVMAHTNDWGAGFTAAGASSGQGQGGTDAIVNADAIIKTALDAGKTLIYVIDPPRGDSNHTSVRLSASNLLRANRLRHYLLGLRGTPGLYIVDTWPQMALVNSSTGDIIEALAKDGLHPNAYGALRIAQAIQPTIEAIIPPIFLLPTSNADQYDATLNPYGNLLTNGMMDGTGGTKNTNGTGSLADSWSENATPGFTRAFSKVTGSDGRTWQQIVLGGTVSTTGCSTRQVITAANLAVGDRVFAVADVEIDATVVDVVALALQLTDNTSIFCGDMRPTATTERVPAVAVTGVMRTPIMTLASTTLHCQLFQQVVAASATLAATWRVGRVGVFKVP